MCVSGPAAHKVHCLLPAASWPRVLHCERSNRHPASISPAHPLPTSMSCPSSCFSPCTASSRAWGLLPAITTRSPPSSSSRARACVFSCGKVARGEPIMAGMCVAYYVCTPFSRCWSWAWHAEQRPALTLVLRPKLLTLPRPLLPPVTTTPRGSLGGACTLTAQ